MTGISQLSRPAVFAHRGASAHAPENTLAAFLLAIEQGADGIELDTKLTRDGYPVVIHDQTLMRTTGTAGRVGELRLGELRRLDAGSHYDIAYRGELIPTLDEVFATVGHRTLLNVELTNYASPTDSLPEKVAGLVERHGLAARVIFSSFNPLALVRVRRCLPQVPVGLLALPGWPGAWARSWIGRLLHYDALHPALVDVSPAMVEKVHRHGERINVYTVNQAQEMRRLAQWGVDGLITDDPLLALRVLSVASRFG